jgi:hypothetical protein
MVFQVLMLVARETHVVGRSSSEQTKITSMGVIVADGRPVGLVVGKLDRSLQDRTVLIGGCCREIQREASSV